MTSETDYRGKARAVFLAAIMVISVVGMSVAFTGAAAAQTNTTDFDPDFPYQGQDVTVINDTVDFSDGTYELRQVDEFDDGDVDQSTFVTEVTDVENPDSTDSNLTVETDDLEAGDYFIRGEPLPRNPPEEQTFEVRVQDLDAEFDDDSVTDGGVDSTTDLDIDSNRGTYSVNVSADGDLDEEELLDIAIGNDALVAIHQTDEIRENVTFDGDDQVEFFDKPFDDAVEDEDIATAINTSLNNDDNFDDDFRDAVNATIDDSDVSTIASNGDFVVEDAGEFQDRFFELNQFQAFSFAEDEDDEDEQVVFARITDTEEEVEFNDIDEGDYTFDFDVSDTEATASADITVNEQDIDGAFDQGTYQTGTGDLVHFEFELEDTDEAWVQIGDEDSDFVDVVYVDVDDEDEPVEITANTRLLGGPNASTDEVYDYDNEDDFQSASHDGLDNDALPGTTDQLLFEDDGEFNTGGLDYTGSAPEAQEQFAMYIEELDLIDDAEDFLEGEEIQLTRPLQATDYEMQLAGDDIDNDEGVFDADAGAGEANDQLDSSVLELTQASIGDLNTWTAPEEDADDETDVEELLEIVTEREEIAVDDRLVVQVEATGLYGGMVAGGSGADFDFDRLEDGVSTDVAEDFFDEEEITFEVESEEQTGNQDPLEVRLDDDSDDSDTFIVIGPDQDQFFLIVDTSSDDAFANGDAPDDDESFTATLEYDADNEDERFEFDETSASPFDAKDDEFENYPYLRQGETLSSSVEFDLEQRAVEFDNLNEDDEVQAENIDDSEISGETNVAPGSDAEVRVASTDASSSFRIGETIDINEDGDFSAEFDFSDQEAGDEFDTRFRAEGSTVDTVDSVIVEEGDLGVAEPEDDEDDVVDDDDDVVDDDDDVVDDDDDVVDDDDDVVDDEVDDETPGFGALVALVALIGAALLAARRQN